VLAQDPDGLLFREPGLLDLSVLKSAGLYPCLEEKFRGRSKAVAIIVKNAMTSGPIRIRELLTRAAVRALEVSLPGQTEIQ